MYNMNKISAEEDSEDNSDDNLKIVIESPNSKRKTPPKPTESEKLIIESIEDELQRRLEEKAAKTKLNAIHVKNIIKHVVTNEHVLALVKKAENPTGCNESIPYEPKLTRAKAKELLSSVAIAPMPWTTSKPTSEVQALFTEELQEDSSGDEYIPGEEESEDDRDSSIISDPPSVPPPTPPTPSANIDSYTQTNWTDDGVFKIPPNKSKEEVEEEANIARRTRSKLCLSSTPLEVIEEAFIPPDITTDMYDMDCDNDDWMDFLKKFTRPLDEVAKATEDEEQDPEYNILADEEIDKIDKEELRVDKAVKVTRKELNDLIAELLECSEICNLPEMEKKAKNNNFDCNGNAQSEAPNYSERSKSVDNRKEEVLPNESVTVVINESDNFEEEEDNFIKRSQIPLLLQQMRQHVQLITQNFILTYEHPELHHYSIQLKEYLLNLKFLCEEKQKSAFYALNLMKALQLVEYWQKLLATNNDAVKDMKRHIENTMAECIQHKQSGNIYIPTFPLLILETISNSDVFLYPSLLPKIPFKPNTLFPRHTTFTDSEDQLIALGWEQFESLLKKDRKNLTKSNDVRLKVISSYIQEYIMPQKDMYKIYNHILFYKHPRCRNNPLKYYYQYRKAPPVVHFVSPLHELQVLPPCKRLANQLPYQWKVFNYPNVNVTSATSAQITTTPQLSATQVNPTTEVIPATLNIGVLKPFSTIITPITVNLEKSVLSQKLVTSTPIFPNRRKTFLPRKRRKLCPKVKKVRNKIKDPISKFVECLSRPSVINRLFTFHSDSTEFPYVEESNCINNFLLKTSLNTMLPSMPSLGTPIKKSFQNEASSNVITNVDKNNKILTSVTDAKSEKRKNVLPEVSTISSSSFQQAGSSTEVEFCRPTDNCQAVTCKSESNVNFSLTNEEVPSRNTIQDATGLEKDNPEHTSSSTVKPPGKKEPSGAEKKRAKLRREFLANLSVCAPEDTEIEKQKSEMFALAYYDKMRETLELEEYHKIMQILNDHEEGDAVDLYKKIEKVLVPKYQELAEEFLLFLREKEAAAAGQLVSWIMVNNRSKFLRKLEIYFKDQPAQLRKIYKCLTELSQTADVSMEKIKNTLIPMFKGNAVLCDLFVQNFLNERPPPSLLEGPYETIDVTKDMSRVDDEEIFETITVPDTEDKYGGPSCICNCHQIEDAEFKSRYRHCTRCGTRFVNGKVFIQSGRGLRPATVSFLTNPNEDHNARLIGKTPTVTSQRKKRSETSPSKQVMLSPTKENPDEESEDEADVKKKSKRKSAKKKPSDKASKVSKEPQKTVLTKKSRSSRNSNSKFSNASPTNKEYKTSRKRTYSVKKCKESNKKVDKPLEEKITVKAGSSLGQQKRLANESMEWADNPGISSLELKVNSPGQQTAESESEFCEESSQDNCESDSNSSISSINNHSQSDSNTGEECSWKREEDKIILETFQKENDKEYAFKIIADQLKNRTVPQISNRFQTLMTLLLETLGNS